MVFVRLLSRLTAYAILFASLLLPWQAAAQDCFDELRSKPQDHPSIGRVADIIDPTTLLLTDGTVVRLVGLTAPSPTKGEFFHEQAKSTLSGLTLNQEVTLRFGPAHTDRYGRAMAHVFLSGPPTKPDAWLQAQMVERGMARVYLPKDNRICAQALLMIENAARESLVGFWSAPAFRVRRHDQTEETVGSFQLVEGTVLSAAKRRNRLFLNFGADWREDFTITVTPRNARSFLKEADLFAYEGQTVRVRGWVEEYNGPFIEVTHPDHIEIIQE